MFRIPPQERHNTARRDAPNTPFTRKVKRQKIFEVIEESSTTLFFLAGVVNSYGLPSLPLTLAQAFKQQF